MDQDAMDSVNFEAGRQLIDALMARDVRIEAAFWARLSGEDRWLLYLASPSTDEKGAGWVYQVLHRILHDAPEWGIDPFSVTVCGPGTPMMVAAAEIIKPKTSEELKPYRGMTRFTGLSLGGIGIEGAYIYPHVNQDNILKAS